MQQQDLGNLGDAKDWLVLSYADEKLIAKFMRPNHGVEEHPFNPAEDFYSNLEYLIFVLTVEPKLKGVFFEYVPLIPHELFARVREYFMARKVELWGNDYGTAPAVTRRIVPLSQNRVRLSQWTYLEGPLDEQPILKYGWYDTKFFHSVPTNGDKFAIYSKLVSNGEANIIYLGEVDQEVSGYWIFNPMKLDRNPDLEKELDDLFRFAMGI